MILYILPVYTVHTHLLIRVKLAQALGRLPLCNEASHFGLICLVINIRIFPLWPLRGTYKYSLHL